MIISPPPIKIPSSLQEDKELSNFFKQLKDSVYQLWDASNGNQNAVLISTTKDIDAKVIGTTELLKVPSNKTFIPLSVVIRVTSFTAGSKSTQAVASFGGNTSSYNDFLSAVTYTVSAANTFQIDQPNDATQLVTQTADNSFRIKIDTASNATAEVWAVDLFGYFI